MFENEDGVGCDGWQATSSGRIRLLIDITESGKVLDFMTSDIEFVRFCRLNSHLMCYKMEC